MRWRRRQPMERLGHFQVRTVPAWRTFLHEVTYAKLLIGLVTAGGLLLILYARGATTLPNLKLGEPAPTTVRSPRSETYVDSVETEKLQQQARNSVGPQYDEDTQAAQEAEALAALVFDSIADAKADPTLVTPDAQVARVTQATGLRLPQRLLLAGLQAPVQILDSLRYHTMSIVRGEMQRGIHDNRPDDLTEAEKRMRASADALPFSSDLGELVFLVARSSIRPNQIYSAKKTAARQEEAARAVEPKLAQVRRNQVIVYQGEIVTQRHLDALQALGIARSRIGWFRALGLAFNAGAIVLVLGFYCYRQCRPVFTHDRQLILVAGTVVIHAAVCQLSVTSSFYEVLCLASGVLGSILLAMIAPLRLAVMASSVFGLVTGLASPSGAAHLVVAVTLAGFAAAYASKVVGRPGEMFSRTVPLVALSNAVLLTVGSSVTGLDPDPTQAGFAAAGGAVGAVVAVLLGLALGQWLGITTDFRLLQLSNPTSPILNRLAIEAPGTYTHTMSVANLVQACVTAVNGNVLLARVGTYYHDIGKLARPQYFAENQFEMENPHDRLEPSLSARIIIAHVKDGLAMAEELGLPPAVRDFIPMHHGTSLVEYFYNKACEIEGEKVSEEGFRHVGPKPRTVETAVLMFADVMEAASRTIEDKSPAKLEAFVERHMQRKIEDGQLDECPITLAQLEKLKHAFVAALAGAYHDRVKYPGQEPRPEETPAELAAKLTPQPVAPAEPEPEAQPDGEITVQNRQPSRVDGEPLKETARRTLELEGLEGPADISIVLVDDAEIQRLNREYRGLDRPTNVLTFDAREDEEAPVPPDEPQPEVWGDVVISVDTARREAEAAGHDLLWELRWLTAHGVLHLTGYDDGTDEGLERMLAQQSAIVGDPVPEEVQGED